MPDPVFVLCFCFFRLYCLGKSCHIGHRQGECDALGLLSHTHTAVEGIEHLIPDVLFHHHHQNFLFRVDGNAEEGGLLLPGNATGIEDGTAPGALLPY